MLDRPMFASDTKTLRSRLHSAFDANGLGNLFGDSFAALGRPLGGVFAFLESDGALIWGVIVVLIALLVNRPGGP